MIPPTFQIGDEVEVTGPDRYGNDTEKKTLTICMLWLDEGKTFYSDRYSPWYPASSLRLVNEKPLLPMHITYNYKPDDCEHGTFQVSCPCGRKVEIDPNWPKLDEELKIGDWVEVIGPAVGGSTAERGSIFQITQDKTMCTGLSTLGKAAYLPTSLRKLTPEEIKQHQTAQMLPKSTEIQELRRRIHDLEMSLNGFTNGPEPEYVSGILHVKDPIQVRLSAIEKRLDFVEKFQRGQAEYRRGMLWMAGP